MEQKLLFCTWLFTILPSFAAVLCHQTICNPWGFGCTTPINFNQSQENKLLSKALWKYTAPFLTIILLWLVWWGIFRRQSWMLYHFNTCSLCIMKSALFAACSIRWLAADLVIQMTKLLTSVFLYMKQIKIFQGRISCVVCMCVKFYRMERLV